MKKNNIKKKKNLFKVIFAILPLILAGTLLSLTLLPKPKINAGEFMSPVENTTLVVSLLVFIAGYAIFLVLMFSDNLKSFFIKHTHKR